MKSDNLIKGQKPEFGNTDQIKWLQKKAEIMNGEINFDEITWQSGRFINRTETHKPIIKKDTLRSESDCLYFYLTCPKCERQHILYYFFDNQATWYDELISIDMQTDEGFECWNCGLEMHTDYRMIYVKQPE